jgi:hypothetical protein
MHRAVLDRSNDARLIDFDRVMIDGSHVRAKRGAATGPSPVARAKSGSKHHLLTCGNGFPLVVELSAANINDRLMLPVALGRLRPLRGRPGPPRRRITTLITDKGYTSSRSRSSSNVG